MLYTKQNGLCFFCGMDLWHKTRTIDHWIPRSKGGKDEPSNMVLTCLPCNAIKKDFLPELSIEEVRKSNYKPNHPGYEQAKKWLFALSRANN